LKNLQLYTFYHLNLTYSSIEEEQHEEVINNCYWPLLKLAKKYKLPFGIEASCYTLESINAIDPDWILEFRNLIAEGTVELIGSGYTQLIGPLVPAEVNSANLKIGNQIYKELLGVTPQVALVNEQAYSSGLVNHYINAGYKAIIMEWENPAKYHPDWNSEFRFLPQFACDDYGNSIPLIWNDSIAFQKFQRYAHQEMELHEYVNYLEGHLSEFSRAFPLYGNDVEIFDFRPGRYHTEAILKEKIEWLRIEDLFKAILADDRFNFILPSSVLALSQPDNSGNMLHLESAEQPIPVKKQSKYNITRWAITGRDDFGINTACHRIYKALIKAKITDEEKWKELCFLWSSDFRTHITEKRWKAYRKRLDQFEKKVSSHSSESFLKDTESTKSVSLASSDAVSVIRDGRFITVETKNIRIRLNKLRGMAIDALWFKTIDEGPLIGTIPHGYYDDISLGADFYSGHFVMEMPGQPKIADLIPVDPVVSESEDGELIFVSVDVNTLNGPVRKQISINNKNSNIELTYTFDWTKFPIGSFRLGHTTVLSNSFDKDTLFYRTHNGGDKLETFYPTSKRVDHGSAVSFLTSSNCAVDLTYGCIEMGDSSRFIRLSYDKSIASMIGLITYIETGNDYFYRLALSATEMDDTSRKKIIDSTYIPGSITIAISAFSDNG